MFYSCNVIWYHINISSVSKPGIPLHSWRHGKQGIILGRKGLTTLKKVCKKVKNSETYKGIAFIESSYRVTEFKKRKKKWHIEANTDKIYIEIMDT